MQNARLCGTLPPESGETLVVAGIVWILVARSSAYLQALEEGEDGVGRAIAARFGARRGYPCQRSFLEFEVGVEVDLHRAQILVAQP